MRLRGDWRNKCGDGSNGHAWSKSLLNICPLSFLKKEEDKREYNLNEPPRVLPPHCKKGSALAPRSCKPVDLLTC
jgi:hypothetical protein